jgi:hypothetical protein
VSTHTWMVLIALCPRRVLRVVDRLALALLIGCGGAQTNITDPDAGDATADVGELDAGDELADVLELDQGAGDAPHDVAGDTCTPLTIPTQLPASCTCEGTPVPPCTGGTKGCVWSVGQTSCSSGCWTYPLAGSSSCESCVETYNCACIGPLLGDAGLGSCSCKDGKNGPYLVCP